MVNNNQRLFYFIFILSTTSPSSANCKLNRGLNVFSNCVSDCVTFTFNGLTCVTGCSSCVLYFCFWGFAEPWLCLFIMFCIEDAVVLPKRDSVCSVHIIVTVDTQYMIISYLFCLGSPTNTPHTPGPILSECEGKREIIQRVVQVSRTKKWSIMINMFINFKQSFIYFTNI